MEFRKLAPAMYGWVSNCFALLQTKIASILDINNNFGRQFNKEQILESSEKNQIYLKK